MPFPSTFGQRPAQGQSIEELLQYMSPEARALMENDFVRQGTDARMRNIPDDMAEVLASDNTMRRGPSMAGDVAPRNVPTAPAPINTENLVNNPRGTYWQGAQLGMDGGGRAYFREPGELGEVDGDRLEFARERLRDRMLNRLSPSDPQFDAIRTAPAPGMVPVRPAALESPAPTPPAPRGDTGGGAPSASFRLGPEGVPAFDPMQAASIPSPSTPSSALANVPSASPNTDGFPSQQPAPKFGLPPLTPEQEANRARWDAIMEERNANVRAAGMERGQGLARRMAMRRGDPMAFAVALPDGVDPAQALAIMQGDTGALTDMHGQNLEFTLAEQEALRRAAQESESKRRFDAEFGLRKDATQFAKQKYTDESKDRDLDRQAKEADIKYKTAETEILSSQDRRAQARIANGEDPLLVYETEYGGLANAPAEVVAAHARRMFLQGNELVPRREAEEIAAARGIPREIVDSIYATAPPNNGPPIRPPFPYMNDPGAAPKPPSAKPALPYMDDAYPYIGL